MLLLLAALKAKTASVDKVESILRSLVDVTREERGNIAYVVHKREDDPSRFVLYELYRDRDSCNEHLQRDDVKDALKKLEPLLDLPAEITFCSTVAAAGIAPDNTAAS